MYRLLKIIREKIKLSSLFAVASLIILLMVTFSPSCGSETESETENVWSENIKITYDAIGPHPRDITLDGNNVYVVWGEDRFDSSIIYKKSENGGRTWSEDVSLSNESVAGPTMAISGDNIFVAWTKDCGTTEANFDIYSTRSNDGGKTWEKEKKLIDGSEWAAVPIVRYSNNILYIFWEANSYLKYMKSMDNGKTWSKSVTLSNEKLGSFDASVNGNDIHVVWNGMNEDDHIYYRASHDGGDTWSKIKNLGFLGYYPQIAVDGNTIHIAYYYPMDGDYKTFYLRSTDNGENWDTSNDFVEPSGIKPKIVAVNGAVNMVLESTRDGNMEIYYKKSVDGGVHWSCDTRLTFDEDDSFDPVIGADQDYVYVVWADYNFTENWCYVYFKRTAPYPGFLTENISLPVINVISPNRWDIVDNIVWINGTAYATNSNLTIQKVEIRFSDLGEWQTANGTANWSYCWNTINEHDGYHQLFIRVYDGASYSEYYVLPLYVRTEGGGGLIVDLPSPTISKWILAAIGIFVAVTVILIYWTKKYRNK